MDDDASLSFRNWGFYETMKGNLGLQLMSSVPADQDTKPLLQNGTFLQHHTHHNAPHHPRDCGGGASGGLPTEPPAVHIDFARNDAWMHPSQHQHPHPSQHQHLREQKVHAPPVRVGPAGHIGHPGLGGHAVHHHPTGYGMLPEAHGLHTLQMMQPQEPPPLKEEHISEPLIEENSVVRSELPTKKRKQRQPKTPRPKKPKKPPAPREDGAPNGHAPRRRGPKKALGMVINGGWQSACCTTSISTYPLPMSTKRRGVRIAGRKMSQGAFKKVLEKLAGEGYNLANPIDLKTFWAKHGTNKFVTIR